MASDIKLQSFDAKKRKATYRGSTPVTDRSSLEFGLHLTLPAWNMTDQSVTLKLELDAYEDESFDACRKRMALWLRNVAEALEGEVITDIPIRMNRTSKEAVHHTKKGEVPMVGDEVIYKGEKWSVERLAARDQVKLWNKDSALFVPLSEMDWNGPNWFVNPDWNPDWNS